MEDRIVEITAAKENIGGKKRMTINAESQGNFCASTKHTNLHIIGDPEEERERTQENI